MNQACISIRNLTVAYHHKVVFDALTVDVPKHALVGLVGPNGAGKSSLLKAMMELIPVRAGEVTFFGKRLQQMRKHISYVPQRSSVDWSFPASVYDVVMMGRYAHLGIFGKIRAIDKEKVYAVLEVLGLSALMHRQIGELSGGQQQRLFIARALAQESDIYLLDEPCAAIDAKTKVELLTLFKRLVKEEGKTVVTIHHNLKEVQDYCDWTMLLNKGLVAAGATKDVFTNALLQQTYEGALPLLQEER